MGNLSISPILDFAIKKGASDIHITEGAFIVLRINGKLVTLDSTGKLEKIKVNQILLELMEEQKDLIKQFVANKDIDFSYNASDGITYRVNAFYKLGKVAFIMRKIESNIRTYDELLLPEGARTISKMKSGLVIISGPSGSGKSSTVTTILNDINNSRGEHIITIEDPVEYIHKNNNSIFSQRSVGRDTKDFSTALQSSLREDPNIVMIGELKDKETLDIAINMALSGVLVITTINSTGTSDMITKLAGFYDMDEQGLIYSKLSNVIACSIFQQLVTKKDGTGRIPVFEVLLMNNNMKLLLKAGKINEVADNIQVSKKDLMISLNGYSEILVEKGLITKEFQEEHFPIQ